MSENLSLLEVRRKLGLTQQELADALGMARAYISAVERGVNPFSKKLRKKICEIFPDAFPSSSISVIGNSGPVAVGSPGASLGGASPPGEGALSARVAALEARVSALERALVAALGKGRAD